MTGGKTFMAALAVLFLINPFLPSTAYSRVLSVTVTVGPHGNIFAADFYNNRVQKFSPEGKFLVVIGSEKSGSGGLKHPTDVAVDADGSVYVADFGNRRIARFVPAGPEPGSNSP